VGAEEATAAAGATKNPSQDNRSPSQAMRLGRAIVFSVTNTVPLNLVERSRHAVRFLLSTPLRPRKNATAMLGAEMAGLGLNGPALIVGGRSPIRLLAETWKRTFADAGIAYAVHEFGGECSLAEIERIKQVARQNKSQVVVGAGGGKVLDAARAAAADLTCRS